MQVFICLFIFYYVHIAVHLKSKIHSMASLEFVTERKIWFSGRENVIRFYFKILGNFMRLIL